MAQPLSTEMSDDVVQFWVGQSVFCNLYIYICLSVITRLGNLTLKLNLLVLKNQNWTKLGIGQQRIHDQMFLEENEHLPSCFRTSAFLRHLHSSL